MKLIQKFLIMLIAAVLLTGCGEESEQKPRESAEKQTQDRGIPFSNGPSGAPQIGEPTTPRP